MKVSEYRTKYRPSEHQIQTAIINFLQAKGYYVQRMNAGKIPIGDGRNRRLIQMAQTGTPDIMAFKSYQNIYKGVNLYFIEVKVKGNKPTFHQEHKMKELEEYGARCFVAHSVEEVEAVIN